MKPVAAKTQPTMLCNDTYHKLGKNSFWELHPARENKRQRFKRVTKDEKRIKVKLGNGQSKQPKIYADGKTSPPGYKIPRKVYRNAMSRFKVNGFVIFDFQKEMVNRGMHLTKPMHPIPPDS